MCPLSYNLVYIPYQINYSNLRILNHSEIGVISGPQLCYRKQGPTL